MGTPLSWPAAALSCVQTLHVPAMAREPVYLASGVGYAGRCYSPRPKFGLGDGPGHHPPP